ncbi:unnamed protein product [Angiostrongylus costaricensis]|uniref:Translation factor GUF1 homolog, mitochondrial n=1 Tax=Angiostrongylus costaricensis TaxID=334426 RepID=A0A0R3PQA7_ANGCS|nr:unnamed protein product [Angiostrongylus costaricensis]
MEWLNLFKYRNCRCFSFRPDDSIRLDLSKYPPEKIRNFSIVAHVDHGKSTLADRLLELSGVVKRGERCSQILDRLPVERERGITVKAQTSALPYKDYLLNLIDTPGHVDFSAEVCRSLSVCDGILLVIAANEGVQAQTLANFWLAFERNIRIIPVINKIDLSGANISKVESQLKNLFGFDAEECLKISAKSGLNVENLFDSIVQRVPFPAADAGAPFRAQIFDSMFDHFRGAIALIRVMDGSVQKGQKIRSFHYGKEYEVLEVPSPMIPVEYDTMSVTERRAGRHENSQVISQEARVGETLFEASRVGSIVPFADFNPSKPTVYAGLFPVETSQYDDLKQALERLSLNDPSVSITPDFSPALGLGWKVGFLGVLHMEVFGARLEKEYGANIILSHPSVEYKAIIKNNETVRKKRFGGKGEISIIDASKFPCESDIEKFLEPVVKVIQMVVPTEFMGTVNGLCSEHRGERGEISSVDEDRLLIIWRLPLAEVIIDFFDRLKQLTSGYVTFDYELDGYLETSLVKVTITINGREVPEFSQITPATMARERAKLIVHRLKREIPRQQYEVTIKGELFSGFLETAAVTLSRVARSLLPNNTKSIDSKFKLLL